MVAVIFGHYRQRKNPDPLQAGVILAEGDRNPDLLTYRGVVRAIRNGVNHQGWRIFGEAFQP